jgi:hypothetical protein
MIKKKFKIDDKVVVLKSSYFDLIDGHDKPITGSIVDVCNDFTNTTFYKVKFDKPLKTAAVVYDCWWYEAECLSINLKKFRHKKLEELLID